jgi:hypothetical protein
MTETKRKRPRSLAEQKAALEQRQAEIAQRLRDIKAKEAATARKERTGRLIALGLAVDSALERGQLEPEQVRGLAVALGKRERERIERHLASLTHAKPPLDSPPTAA